MKTVSLLLTATIASLFAAPAVAAPQIVPLDTVQVRASAEQIAQRRFEQASGIATLATVQVRPSVAQWAERNATQRVVTLATVQVRPDAGMGSMLAVDDVVGNAVGGAMQQLRPSLQDLGQSLTIGLLR